MTSGKRGSLQPARGPGIALLVVGGLGALVSLMSLAFSPFMKEQALQQPGMTEETLKIVEFAYGPGTFVLHGWGLVASILGIIGGFALMNGGSKPKVIIGAIALMTVPGCCCCVAGIGAGIWALIAVNGQSGRD